MKDYSSGNLLQWLRGFYQVAQSGGVTQAAKSLDVNQSAVSHQIKNLEKEFQATLFHRSKKGVDLTSQGQRLYQKAEAIFELLREARQDLHQEDGQYSGLISMSLTHTVAQNCIPALVARFYQQNPRVRFVVQGGSSREIYEHVEQGRVDFGVVNPGLAPVPHLETTFLFGARLQVVSPPGNPFNLPAQCSLQDLSYVPFISFLPHFSVENVVTTALHRCKGKLHKVLEAHNYGVLLQHVRAGLGITILDAFAVDGTQGVECIDLAEEMPLRRYALIRRRERYNSPPAKAFQEMLLQTPPPKGCVRLDNAP